MVPRPTIFGKELLVTVRDCHPLALRTGNNDMILTSSTGWFLSAMSALCCMEAKELGNLVERVCVKRDEAAGVYGFVFFRDGEWRSEVIDDKLYVTASDYSNMDSTPEMSYLLKYIKEKDRAEQYRKIVQSNSEALYYAKSAHKNETWVPLIEKAYAKAHGDFTAIEGGWIE